MTRAFQIAGPGTEPAWRDVSLHPPGPGEVRVRIAACGLNFADLLMVAGTYQDIPGYPLTLGMELSGTVEASGPAARGIEPGMRVGVFAGSGGLAEAGVFRADRCLRLPDAMPFDVAAGFQIAYGTSHLALARRARLLSGETLLVLGAAGGVGLTAVEIGHRMGARVIAVARGADRLEAVRRAGADEVIDSTVATDLRGAVMALGGADVIYDPVGGDAFRAAIRCLKPEGRYLCIGFASGDVPDVKPNHLLVKNTDLIGLYWGGYLKFRPDILADSLRTLCDWYADGDLAPQISHCFPADRAAEALGVLKDRRATGKIVVTL
jgi:NADPH:quinone reductase